RYPVIERRAEQPVPGESDPNAQALHIGFSPGASVTSDRRRSSPIPFPREEHIGVCPLLRSPNYKTSEETNEFIG
ncbi:MAG: hypothetical protein P1V19_25450, partial [Gimesia sp.]|nr:hypothetical protein [Gimesia sp.]